MRAASVSWSIERLVQRPQRRRRLAASHQAGTGPAAWWTPHVRRRAAGSAGVPARLRLLRPWHAADVPIGVGLRALRRRLHAALCRVRIGGHSDHPDIASDIEDNAVTTSDQQREKIRTKPGFIAALDQSGGSTPKALRLYGIEEGAWSSDDEMFAIIHQMRTRIVTSPAFDGRRILAAILFENTMDRDIEGKPTASYLWEDKNVVPILKVDKGLADEADGVQVMKPMPGLGGLLEKARTHPVFGTKMRSVIKRANEAGVRAVVEQQFDVGQQILAAGLCPIIEPEVDIKSPDKAACEALLKQAMLERLDALPDGDQVMLKLTLPEEDGFYRDCIEHPKVLKVVALSGGYSREEANARLARQHGMVASFSRALTEGLTAQQSDDEFNAMLDQSIESIFQASST
jgi:fructose-bisphosphate aldolase class I